MSGHGACISGATPNLWVNRRRERVYLAVGILRTVAILMAENLLLKTEYSILGKSLWFYVE